MAQKLKLFQIDPYSVVRSGLRLLLAHESELRIVGEAASCCAAWPLLEQWQPDIIAHQLCLTEGTVKGYVSTILNKLEVDDRTQAAMFAVKHRLVPSL